jgi:hypothetical protein
MTCATYSRPAFIPIVLSILLSILLTGPVLAKPPEEVTVWALTDTKLYHCPRSKFYKIGKGKEMGECQAIREGYRPAYVACGSDCK